MEYQFDIRRAQLRLLEMAKTIAEILEKRNVPHIIAYGTLLGSVRHKGFIPWDDDFDFFLFSDSYDEALQVLSEELPEDLFLENEKTEPLYFHGWAHVKDLNTLTECSKFPQDSAYEHKGLSVDLYKAIKVPENHAKKTLLEAHIAYLDRRRSVGLMDEAIYKEKRASLCEQLSQEIRENPVASERMVYVFPSGPKARLYENDAFPLVKYEFEGHSFFGPRSYDGFLTSCYADYMQLPSEDKRVPHYSNVIFPE